MRIKIITLLLGAISCLISTTTFAQLQTGKDGLPTTKDPEVTEYYTPVPNEVSPGLTPYASPSDAIVLFNGSDASAWQNSATKAASEWSVASGILSVVPGKGNISTKQKFGSFQMHIEWRIPATVTGKGQERGNSGIFLQGLYELQVLDSYHQETYVNGQAGSIYKQAVPLVNACRKPGEWQSYDILFTAPVYSPSKRILYPPRVTVFQNGILILNDFYIQGPTQYIGMPAYTYYDGTGPIMLQDHNNPTSFRNIWIREL